MFDGAMILFLLAAQPAEQFPTAADYVAAEQESSNEGLSDAGRCLRAAICRRSGKGAAPADGGDTGLDMQAGDTQGVVQCTFTGTKPARRCSIGLSRNTAEHRLVDWNFLCEIKDDGAPVIPPQQIGPRCVRSPS